MEQKKQEVIKGVKFLYWIAHLTFPFRSLITRLTNWIYAKRNKRLILIFGISRSGTTMLGQFLSFSRDSLFIHEPVKQIFQYDHNRKQVSKPLWDYVAEIPDSKKMHYLVCTALWYCLRLSTNTKVVCMKIVLANIFLKDVSNVLNFANILYISRHPCGRTESEIRRRTIFETGEDGYSLKQLASMAAHWAERIEGIQKLFTHHPEWIWVIFEVITKNPVDEFRKLYDKLGLFWSDEIRTKIEELTTGGDGAFFETRRDSRAQAYKWKHVLTVSQVEAIRKGCKLYPTNLYEGF